MRSRILRVAAFFVAATFVVGLVFVDADAQRRRRRRARTPRPVVTNPDIAPPGSESTGPEGERIISTADENAADPNSEGSEARKTTTRAASTEPSMQQTINALSNQVNKLNEKLTQIHENDRTLIDMERLTRAEQRAENLRAQQVDVESKLADFQSRLEEAEFSLKPENIERAAAGYGSTRPEEAREARRRALEAEKVRLQTQIRILETSRARLEQSLATADAEVDLLRRKLETQRQQENAGTVQTEPRTTRDKPE